MRGLGLKGTIGPGVSFCCLLRSEQISSRSKSNFLAYVSQFRRISSTMGSRQGVLFRVFMASFQP